MADAAAAFRQAARAQARGELDAAEAGYRALVGAPGAPVASIWANLSAIAIARADPQAAEAAACRALALAPGSANAHNNLGLALSARGEAAAAREAFAAAVRADPTHAEAWGNLAAAEAERGAHEAALAAALRGLDADPSSPAAATQALYLAADTASWDGLDAIIARIRALVASGAAVNPYALFSVCLDPEEMRRAARNCARAAIAAPAAPAVARSPAPRGDGRMTLGYFSSTLRAHATGYLLRRVLEAHDRDRVRLVAYVYGSPRESPEEQAFTCVVRAPFEAVIDVSSMTDAAAAAAIRTDGPDVLLDVDGHANGGRPRVLAARPAPFQASWLGYLGPMGRPLVDAVVADAELVPPGDERFFDEAVLRLPGGFFPGDGARPVSDRFRSRAELGLPEAGAVFCAFNQPRKITPSALATWAAILHGAPGSVLWLWDRNPVATANLRAAFAAQGIGGERLVFAPSLPNPDHLCRYRFADVVLDSWPYNGHTMTSDALYMGAPVVTLRGRTMPSRVAASLLARLGVADALVARTPQDYARTALRLAADPALRRRLSATIRARAPAALFDATRIARELEDALIGAAAARG